MKPQMKRANQLIFVCVTVIFGMLLVAKVAKAQNEVGFSQGYVLGWKAGSVRTTKKHLGRGLSKTKTS